MEVLRRRRDGGQVGDRDQGDEEVEEPLGANESQDLVSLVHFLDLPDGPFSCDLGLLPQSCRKLVYFRTPSKVLFRVVNSFMEPTS